MGGRAGNESVLGAPIAEGCNHARRSTSKAHGNAAQGGGLECLITRTEGKDFEKKKGLSVTLSHGNRLEGAIQRSALVRDF